MPYLMGAASMYKGIVLGAVLAAALVCVGCITVERSESSGVEGVDKIQSGKSTKREVLEWFGPPAAISKKGEVVKVPAPEFGGEAEEVPAEALFELFPQERPITRSHVIYYYQFSRTKLPPTYIFWMERGEEKVYVDKLWILINEDTGVVEDYLLKESGPVEPHQRPTNIFIQPEPFGLAR